MNPLPAGAITWTPIDPTHVIHPAYPDPPITHNDAAMATSDFKVSHNGNAANLAAIYNTAHIVNNSHTLGQIIIGICNFNIIESRLQQSLNNNQQFTAARVRLGITIPFYEGAHNPRERTTHRNQVKTKKGSNEREFIKRILEIVRWWLKNTPAGTQFIADEGNAAPTPRTGEDIHAISTDVNARRAWKYWVQLNLNLLPRHLFGHNQDCLVPAFWLSAQAEPIRQRMACLVIDFGSRVVKWANSPKTLDYLVSELIKSDIFKNEMYTLDYYTQGLPVTWISDLFPFTVPHVRRDGADLFDFTRFTIQQIPRVPASGAAAIAGAMVDDIPAYCTWP
ncbi:uncharacterized protein DFL_003056 [Arthrobotrys flagrans]|uniref:Uncharacterized protein n=1 Tax=Arthrobotrys flagrans TaxID=97331 RepID=A0A436ZV32_ARTFL|nr:hypothetical protein DFL_007008 [Arthrobotrys flagrans]RVD88890.1 hypothetical protein DFL_003056 [Arthrobotrys flagrans]